MAYHLHDNASKDAKRQHPAQKQQDDVAHGLAWYLRNGTVKEHQQAEHMPFINAFFKGELDIPSYTRFLAALRHVYHEMETQLDKLLASSVSPMVSSSPFTSPGTPSKRLTRSTAKDFTNQSLEALRLTYFPNELRRTPALDADLALFAPKANTTVESELEEAADMPSVQNYISALQSAAKSFNPATLVAHSYTRYLGDLSGGQMLKRAARKGFGLQGTEGSAFYEFNLVEDAANFKNLYRARLDATGVALGGPESDLSQEIVMEAKTAFVLNMDLFADMQSFRESLPPQPQPQPSPPQSSSACPVFSPKSTPTSELSVSTKQESICSPKLIRILASIALIIVLLCSWIDVVQIVAPSSVPSTSP